MKQGASISGGMHLALILLLLLSGSLFAASDAKPIVVAEVSLISADEFDAAASAAPDVPRFDPEALPQPEVAVSDALTPEAEVAPEVTTADNPDAPTVADVQPDVSGVQALSEPTVEAVEAPIQPDQLAEDAAPLGESLVEPAAIGNDAPSEVVVPSEPSPQDLASDAPRIDTASAPEQPDDALTAETLVEETVPEAAVDVVVEADPAPAEAPQEATTEIVPEAVDEQSAVAPVAASRPRGRPADLQAQVDAARAAVAATESQAAADAQAEADAAAIEQALQLATAEAADQPAPVQSTPSLGPKLTVGEKDGLRLAVQKCWNVPAGLANAGELVVVVGVELARDGSLVGSPFNIEPAGDLAPGFKQAFEAGRRALLRCQPYKLPADKYEQWRNLEVVFNPKSMVVR